jgi:hypothetical protein
LPCSSKRVSRWWSIAKSTPTQKDNPGADIYVWRLPPSLSTSKKDPDLRAAMLAIAESDRMTRLFRKAPK